jgi:HK97 family phage portal protein
MNFLGLEIKRAPRGSLETVGNRGNWFPFGWGVKEPFAGAWQNNVEWSLDCVLAHHAVYACITLIANDIGKLRQRLVEQDDDGIWSEVTKDSPFKPVLKRPNRYQNQIQFKQWWMTSKLIKGNTYGLKVRDNRGIVKEVYVLDPCRVTVLVAPDGSVYYQLNPDNLTGIEDSGITVPASEIIHDRMNCLFHPLVGVSPIFACGAAANIGLRIQNDSSNFFANGANPGGILMVPGSIPQEKANELKEKWNTNYGGDNAGKVAILPDGMKFQPMRMSAVESQLIEQMRWTAEVVCSTFHIPPYMIGVGQMPTYNNVEALNQQYYTQCLQSLIEEYETCWDDGIGLSDKIEGTQKGVDLDLDGLLRMDQATQMKVLRDGTQGGILTTDEARQKIDRKRVAGGNVIFKQQQDIPISVLAAVTSVGTPVVAPAIETEPAGDEPLSDDDMDEAIAA